MSSSRIVSGPSGAMLGSLRLGQRLDRVEPREASATRPRVARWPRLMIQPSASSGQTSCSSSVMKSVNWPIVRLPSIASRPPKKSTAAIPSEGRKIRPGQEARLDARLAHRLGAHGLGAAA